MRLEQNPENCDYAEWLLQIGHGTVPVNPEGKVKFSDNMKCALNTVKSLIDSIYPAIEVPGTANDQYLLERTILCPRNEEVNLINSDILDRFPGEPKTYLSADTIDMEGGDNSALPIEFLNSINAGGLPLHKVELKESVPIMLLRNLSAAEGLCNGT